jgi:peptidoglycan hydrolase CwlO-like protein
MKSLFYKLLCITFVVAIALGQTGCGGRTRRQLRSTERELDEVKKAQQAQQQQLEHLQRTHSATHSGTPTPY